MIVLLVDIEIYILNGNCTTVTKVMPSEIATDKTYLKSQKWFFASADIATDQSRILIMSQGRLVSGLDPVTFEISNLEPYPLLCQNWGGTISTRPIFNQLMYQTWKISKLEYLVTKLLLVGPQQIVLSANIEPEYFLSRI